MINIELTDINNNKEVLQIPSKYELSVIQYSKFIHNEKQRLVDYIVITTNKKYNYITKSEIKKYSSLLNRIGQLDDYTQIKADKKLFLGKYWLKPVKTVGQRIVIEECGYVNEELICFILACGLTGSDDFETIDKLKNKLMNEPYLEILPAGFFFAEKFRKWQELREKKFGEIIIFDKEKANKKAAGIDDLNKYGNIYEIQTLSKICMKSDNEVIKMDDATALMHLLANKAEVNYQQKLNEIRK